MKTPENCSLASQARTGPNFPPNPRSFPQRANHQFASLAHDRIENSSGKPDTFSNDRCQSWRWSADVLIPCQPHRRNDRRGDHQCRCEPVCHPLLVFHRLPSLLLLASYRPPHQAHGSPQTSDPPRRDLMGELSLKNLCWQIAALLATERTHRNDPVIRQRLHRRRNVLVTSFAGYDKRVQAGSLGVKHGFSIGEQTANLVGRNS
jgi:hypothetical protein